MGHRLAPLALLLVTALSCGDNLHTVAGDLLVSPQIGLYTDESGGTATFSIALTSPPSERVVVTITSLNVDEGTVSPRTLIFNADSYARAQVVTITGVDDARADGDRDYAVRIGTDFLGSYELTVTNGDDDTAGIMVSPVVGLMTSESGLQATFTVQLTSQPVAPVTVPLASNDATEGTASPTSLTFTSDNWNSPQTVTVTGVQDGVPDGPITYSIALGAATSSDASYSGFDADDVQLVNDDDDVFAIVVTPTSGLVVSEAATQATFSVVLQTQPIGNVTIPVMSNDTTEATVSTASLLFTTGDWNTPQTVTVTGVDDALDDGDLPFTIVLGAATSSDPVYDGVDPSDVTGTTTDDDGAGVTVTPTSGLVVSETGTQAAFSVVLQTQPTADVTIAVASTDTTEATVSTGSLVFTPGNWNIAQPVTVTGVDDALDDGDVSFTITLAAATSSDAAYAGVDPSDVTGTTIDNDGAGTISVMPTTGLVVSESGTQATFTVVLQAQPTATVTIPVASSDTTEATASTMSLAFTVGNWSTPQTVTVTGVDDALDDGDRPFTIALGAATSSDTAYDGVDPTDVTGTTTDNDSTGVTVTPTSGLTTTESGGTATFTVRLTSQPTATVTIPVSSSDPTEGTVDPMSLVFDASTWMTPQTVTVTGVDDMLVDGPQDYAIVLAAATSSDATYTGFNPADVAATNTDNDTAGFTFDQTSLVVSEFRDADAFSISLSSPPTADVVINVSSDDTTEGTVAPATLTFTPQNWNVPQPVTVTGVDDTLADGNITFSIVLAAASSADPAYNGLNPDDVQVVNLDNDTAQVYVKARNRLTVSENGQSSTFRVQLTIAPTATVTCTLFSSDTTEGTVSPTTLTFQPNNFGFQTVTVTGVDDMVADGDIQFIAVLNPCTSTDLAYQGSNPRDVAIVNRDND